MDKSQPASGRCVGLGGVRYWLSAVFGPAALGPIWVFAQLRREPAEQLGTFAGLVAVLLVAVCTYTDLLWRKIPNWATYSALTWSLVINAATSLARTQARSWEAWAGWLGGVGLAEGLVGAAVCFVLMLLPYRLAGGGAGDVKLATALGGLLGLQRGVDALVVSYIVAGVVLGAWAVWKLGPVAVFGDLARWFGSFVLPGLVSRPETARRRFLASPMPLAAFFAVGALAVLAGWGVPW